MATCMICGEISAWAPVFSLPEVETGEMFTIERCPACGLMRTWPAPNNLVKYYQGNIGRLMESSGGRFYEYLKTVSLRREFALFQPPDKKTPLLDIGCGSGDFSLFVHQQNYSVVAVDLPETRPVRIREVPAIRYYRMNIDDYSIPGLERCEGGVVIVRHVLEHLKDPLRFLNAMIRIGVRSFYIAVPNARSPVRKIFGRYWWAWDPPRHLWHFTDDSLGALLARGKVNIIRHGYVHSPMIGASIYRYLKIRGQSTTLCRLFDPKGDLCGWMGVIDVILGRGVIGVYGQVEP